MDIESKKYREILGKKVKFFRKRLGLTQIDLMKNLGYTSNGIISQIESGKRGMDLTKIHRTADLFSIDISILLSPYKYEDEQLSILLGVCAILKKGKSNSKYKRLKSLIL